MQEREASRPSATVTLGTGSRNTGVTSAGRGEGRQEDTGNSHTGRGKYAYTCMNTYAHINLCLCIEVSACLSIYLSV